MNCESYRATVGLDHAQASIGLINRTKLSCFHRKMYVITMLIQRERSEVMLSAFVVVPFIAGLADKCTIEDQFIDLQQRYLSIGRDYRQKGACNFVIPNINSSSLGMVASQSGTHQ